MKTKEQHLIDLLTPMFKGNQSERVQTAQQVVDLLKEEGVLHLGYGDADIDQVLATFQESFSTTKTNKPDRFAANRLVRLHGAQSVCGVIKLLAQNSARDYVPVVNNVVELEKKWNSVLHFIRKQNTTEILD